MDLTQLTRLPEMASRDRRALDLLLDEAVVGHVALAATGGENFQPVVLPTAIARDGDRVLIHGSTGSRWMRALATGARAALAVTALDGLVVARSAFESSMRYRSAVIFGCCAVVGDAAEKSAALDLLTDKLLPGRVAEVRRPSAKELAATLVLTLPLDRWSFKVSDGWPEDPPADVAGPAWAGVIPLRTVADDPLPAPDLTPGVPVTASVRNLGRSRTTDQP